MRRTSCDDSEGLILRAEILTLQERVGFPMTYARRYYQQKVFCDKFCTWLPLFFFVGVTLPPWSTSFLGVGH